MNEKYVLDVERNHEDLASDILTQFNVDGKVNIHDCERYKHGDKSISSFYVSCSSKTWENLRTILKDRGVELI